MTNPIGMDAAAMMPPDNDALPPHEFKGRLDRWCEVPGCDRPDRNPIHVWVNRRFLEATDAPSATSTARPSTSGSDRAPAPAADKSSVSSGVGYVSRAIGSRTPKGPGVIGNGLLGARASDRRSAESGSRTTSTEPSSAETPPSGTSDPPSRPSKRRWPIPKNAMEFASQARTVMTMYLNGEMGREEVQTYSAVARTVAQALSTEVTRARAERGIPELTFNDIEFEED